MSVPFVQLILDLGLRSPHTPVATSTCQDNLVHLDPDCSDAPVTLTATPRSLAELAAADDYCWCVEVSAHYHDLLGADTAELLTHLVPDDNFAGYPLSRVAVLRHQATQITDRCLQLGPVARTRVTDLLAEADHLTTTVEYAADAAYDLVTAAQGILTDRRSAPGWVSGLPAGHAARATAGLDVLVAAVDADLLDAVVHSYGTRAVLPQDAQEALPGVWAAVTAHTAWFQTKVRAPLDPLVGSSACFDPTEPALVRVPTAWWWTMSGKQRLVPLVDASVPRHLVSAATRLTSGDPNRVEDVLSAMAATAI